MRKLVFLVMLAAAFGFSKADAASQPGVDCDLVADLTATILKNGGFSNEQVLDATYDAFWGCIGNGGGSNRIVDL